MLPEPLIYHQLAKGDTVTLPQVYAFFLSYLPAAFKDLLMKLSIGWIGNVFLLDCSIPKGFPFGYPYDMEFITIDSGLNLIITDRMFIVSKDLPYIVEAI
jgi:hypothetical protein